MNAPVPSQESTAETTSPKGSQLYVVFRKLGIPKKYALIGSAVIALFSAASSIYFYIKRQ